MTNYTSRNYRVRPDSFYFDKLPHRLRHALSHSTFTWDSKWFYDRWNKGWTVDHCIAELNKWNLKACLTPFDAKIKKFYAAHGNPTKETGVSPL